MHVGVLGGTGPAGRGIGHRLALSGHEILLGSRRPERAQEAADEISLPNVKGGGNADAAAFGDVVILSVPWEAAMSTAVEVEPHLRGKVLLSMANAVAFIDGKPEPVLPSSGSIALGIQARLPTLRVVAGLHHVPAKSLQETHVELDFDVLCASDDRGALDRVMGLVDSVPGLRAIDAGGLHNASAIEALTPLLISINRRYRTRSGIKVAGV